MYNREAPRRRKRTAKQKPEAREWLENNENEYAFASNNFGSTDEAIEFVDNLYSAGAKYVAVSDVYDEASRISEEGGPYSATLEVTIPKDVNVALEVMVVAASGHPDEMDVIRDLTVRLWWD